MQININKMKLSIIVNVLILYSFTYGICDDEKNNVDNIENIDIVYHQMAVSLILESIDDKNSDLIDDIKLHGADKTHSVLTTCVAQSFYLSVIRNNFTEDNNIDKSYKVAIKRLLNKVGNDNAEKIIRRGYDLDGKEEFQGLRYGIGFFRHKGKVPSKEELEKRLKLFLSINS